MRSGLLFALLLATLPLAQRARAADIIGDLLEAGAAKGPEAAPEAAPQAAPEAPPAAAPDPPPLEGRRRPGQVETLPPAELPTRNPNAGSAPPPDAFPPDQLPLPDRWRVIEAVGVHSRWLDPYNQNTIKGDRPIKGTSDWFFTFAGISDTVIEPRSFPIPVSIQTTSRPGSNDVFGRANSFAGS